MLTGIYKLKKKEKEKIKPFYELINPWEQSKLEVERLSLEFMEELADAINKEVERQIKEKSKQLKKKQQENCLKKDIKIRSI